MAQAKPVQQAANRGMMNHDTAAGQFDTKFIERQITVLGKPPTHPMHNAAPTFRRLYDLAALAQAHRMHA